MPVTIIPKVAVRLPVEAPLGSLVITKLNDRMNIGFVAADAEHPNMKSVVRLLPKDENVFKPKAIGDLAVVDLGRDYSIEFNAVDLGSVVSAFGHSDDIVGGMLIGVDGVLALVLPKMQGEFRYFHVETGFVDLHRPGAANAIILAWSLSVGQADEKRTVAKIDVRPPEPAANPAAMIG